MSWDGDPQFNNRPETEMEMERSWERYTGHLKGQCGKIQAGCRQHVWQDPGHVPKLGSENPN